MHGQSYPEWVNVGHGQVALLLEHGGFDGAPLVSTLQPPGIG